LAWRSNSLYSLSEIVIKKHDGTLPLDKDILLSLSAVGNYIALAVICFSTGIPEPILDTNTVRIIGRIFNLKINDSSRRNMKFEKIMWKLVEQSDPEIFLFSMIDFGAKICTSQKPKCGLCPVNDICCFTTKNGGKLK
jgi:A/G-specific adenine glycosylase